MVDIQLRSCVVGAGRLEPGDPGPSSGRETILLHEAYEAACVFTSDSDATPIPVEERCSMCSAGILHTSGTHPSACRWRRRDVVYRTLRGARISTTPGPATS